MTDLNILSLNVRGLKSDYIKRKKIFNIITNKHPDLALLQETHSIKAIERQWEQEWGGKIIFNHGTSNSRGVAILVAPKLNDSITDVTRDDEGRCIIVNILQNNTTYTIVNIYAPTQNYEKEQITLIQKVHNLLSSQNPENIIIGGDFNSVLNPAIDKRGGNTDTNKGKKYRSELHAFINTQNLCDIWRAMNNNKFDFTWHCKKTKIFCRLDFWLISEHLANKTSKTEILPTVNSDHKIITLILASAHQKRGPSYWKFNTLLLRDTEYTDFMNAVITDSIIKHEHENKNLMWELIKMEIRQATITYTKVKRKRENTYEKELQRELIKLNEQIKDGGNENQIIEEMTRVEQNIKSIENERINSIIFRSKAKWTEDGEKNSSYFLKLEKKQYLNKHITQLIVGDNIVTDPNQILLEEKIFYESLYSERETSHSLDHSIDNLLTSLDIPHISTEQKELCELKIDIPQCSKILKVMKNGKTPGIDGLPPEFYKFFWPLIQDHVVNALNYTYKTGEMSTSQRLGVITLIPKKDKDRTQLKNWRPISLLTTDYKLLTKMLANNLSNVLPTVINNDQTAYLKGRYIGENIRTITDIIDLCKAKNMTAALLLVDFEKAFDTVRWKFLFKILQKFNFGTIFIKWIHILYSNIQSTIINNGYFSPYFNIQRGVRQGCPISAYLFLLVVEILAVWIRANKNINGIRTKHKEIKISQLADDTTLIIQNEKSITEIFNVLHHFESISGLKANIDKTQAFLIGKHTKFKQHEKIPWNTGPIKILGISICKTEQESYIQNFEPKIKQIKTLFNIWKQRRLSLKGKITIINSLAASLLVYPCTCLRTPERAVTEVNKLFFDFLWDNSTSKIAKNTIIKPIDEGGLKMINFETKVKSLKLSWINRALKNPNSNWMLLISEMLNDIPFDYLLQCRSDCSEYIKNIPPFYQDIYQTWKFFKFKEPANKLEILQENFWLNNHINIGKKPILWKKWLLHGIKTIDDITDTNGSLLSQRDIKTKYNISCNFLEYLQISQSIPKLWKNELKSTDATTPLREKSDNLFLKIDSIYINFLTLKSKDLYWLLIKELVKDHKPTSITKWRDTYNIEDNTWCCLFQIPFKSCQETLLQSFQYRIIHRILPCNLWLYMLKTSTSSDCEYRFCNNVDTDTIKHFLIDCSPVHDFWNSFVNWWNNLDFLKLNPLSELHILLGFTGNTQEETLLNFCLILGKYFIYTCKRNQCQIFFLNYLCQLKQKLTIREFICSKDYPNHPNNLWSHLLEQL